MNDGDNSSFVTIEFSEAVSGFDVSDLSATNGTLSDFTQVDADSYTAVFTANDGIEATGSVSLTGSYTDAAGNTGSGGSDTFTGFGLNTGNDVIVQSAGASDVNVLEYASSVGLSQLMILRTGIGSMISNGHSSCSITRRTDSTCEATCATSL